MHRDDLLGVVLAGGASRRMGRDKALLELEDPERPGEGPVSLAERAARRLQGLCREVVIADRGRGLVSGRVSLADGPGAGPAAGLLGAAAYRPDAALLVLACDLPRIPGELLRALAGRRLGRESTACVPRWRRGVEPLCALYRPVALSELGRRVAVGRFALHGWLATLNVDYLEGEEVACFGSPEEIFLNLNRPEDLEAWSTLRGNSIARTGD